MGQELESLWLGVEDGARVREPLWVVEDLESLWVGKS